MLDVDDGVNGDSNIPISSKWLGEAFFDPQSAGLYQETQLLE